MSFIWGHTYRKCFHERTFVISISCDNFDTLYTSITDIPIRESRSSIHTFAASFLAASLSTLRVTPRTFQLPF